MSLTIWLNSTTKNADIIQTTLVFCKTKPNRLDNLDAKKITRKKHLFLISIRLVKYSKRDATSQKNSKSKFPFSPLRWIYPLKDTNVDPRSASRDHLGVVYVCCCTIKHAICPTSQTCKRNINNARISIKPFFLTFAISLHF